MVDGAPYLMLGAQTNNSSAWPATLPQVWPAVEYLHVNTVEMPIYWEQFEPKPGQFDYYADRYAAGPGARAPRASGAALVRHMEERQPALHARVDEAGPGELLPRDQQERRAGGLALALCPGVAGGGHPRIHRVHGAPEGSRPAAHRAHGAGGERDRHMGNPARLLAARAEALRRAGAGRGSEGDERVARIAHARTGRMSSARRPR